MVSQRSSVKGVWPFCAPQTTTRKPNKFGIYLKFLDFGVLFVFPCLTARTTSVGLSYCRLFHKTDISTPHLITLKSLGFEEQGMCLILYTKLTELQNIFLSSGHSCQHSDAI